LQAANVGKLDRAAAIFDQIGILQPARFERDAGALHAEQMRKEVLRQDDLVAADDLAGGKNFRVRWLLSPLRSVSLSDFSISFSTYT
jgi:hypothetical protein